MQRSKKGSANKRGAHQAEPKQKTNANFKILRNNNGENFDIELLVEEGEERSLIQKQEKNLQPKLIIGSGANQQAENQQSRDRNKISQTNDKDLINNNQKSLRESGIMSQRSLNPHLQVKQESQSQTQKIHQQDETLKEDKEQPRFQFSQKIQQEKIKADRYFQPSSGHPSFPNSLRASVADSYYDKSHPNDLMNQVGQLVQSSRKNYEEEDEPVLGIEEDFKNSRYRLTTYAQDPKIERDHQGTMYSDNKIQDFSLALSSSKLDTDPNLLENHALLSSSIHRIEKSTERNNEKETEKKHFQIIKPVKTKSGSPSWSHQLYNQERKSLDRIRSPVRQSLDLSNSQTPSYLLNPQILSTSKNLSQSVSLKQSPDSQKRNTKAKEFNASIQSGSKIFQMLENSQQLDRLSTTSLNRSLSSGFLTTKSNIKSAKKMISTLNRGSLINTSRQKSPDRLRDLLTTSLAKEHPLLKSSEQKRQAISQFSVSNIIQKVKSQGKSRDSKERRMQQKSVDSSSLHIKDANQVFKISNLLQASHESSLSTLLHQQKHQNQQMQQEENGYFKNLNDLFQTQIKDQIERLIKLKSDMTAKLKEQQLILIRETSLLQSQQSYNHILAVEVEHVRNLQGQIVQQNLELSQNITSVGEKAKEIDEIMRNENGYLANEVINLVQQTERQRQEWEQIERECQERQDAQTLSIYSLQNEIADSDEMITEMSTKCLSQMQREQEMTKMVTSTNNELTQIHSKDIINSFMQSQSSNQHRRNNSQLNFNDPQTSQITKCILNLSQSLSKNLKQVPSVSVTSSKLQNSKSQTRRGSIATGAGLGGGGTALSQSVNSTARHSRKQSINQNYANNNNSSSQNK